MVVTISHFDDLGDYLRISSPEDALSAVRLLSDPGVEPLGLAEFLGPEVATDGMLMGTDAKLPAAALAALRWSAPIVTRKGDDSWAVHRFVVHLRAKGYTDALSEIDEEVYREKIGGWKYRLVNERSLYEGNISYARDFPTM
jgi:hypothetical protein